VQILVFFLGIFLGIPVGVVSSLAAWWFLWRVLAPHGQFSRTVCMAASYDGREEYRVKFRNDSRRFMMDANFRALLYLPGASEGGESQPIIQITLAENWYPVIGAAVKKADGVLERDHRILVMRPDRVAADLEMSRVPEPHRNALTTGKADALVALMNEFPGSSLQLLCVVSDGGTGARRAITSPAYRPADFVRGKFLPDRELDVVQHGTHANTPPEGGA
jgi:hypothetical protein